MYCSRAVIRVQFIFFSFCWDSLYALVYMEARYCLHGISLDSIVFATSLAYTHKLKYANTLNEEQHKSSGTIGFSLSGRSIYILPPHSFLFHRSGIVVAFVQRHSLYLFTLRLKHWTVWKKKQGKKTKKMWKNQNRNAWEIFRCKNKRQFNLEMSSDCKRKCSMWEKEKNRERNLIPTHSHVSGRSICILLFNTRWVIHYNLRKSEKKSCEHRTLHLHLCAPKWHWPHQLKRWFWFKQIDYPDKFHSLFPYYFSFRSLSLSWCELSCRLLNIICSTNRLKIEKQDK